MFVISTASVKLPDTDDCHFTIVPTFPVKVNSVLFIPVQTIAFEPTAPPTEAGSTVTVATLPVAIVTSQLFASLTLNKVYTNVPAVPVGAVIFDVVVKLLPELIL